MTGLDSVNDSARFFTESQNRSSESRIDRISESQSVCPMEGLDSVNDSVILFYRISESQFGIQDLQDLGIPERLPHGGLGFCK